jgi:hypothetical protein
MANLKLDTEGKRASRDMWLEHLRGEVESLRREIAAGENAGPEA